MATKKTTAKASTPAKKATKKPTPKTATTKKAASKTDAPKKATPRTATAARRAGQGTPTTKASKPSVPSASDLAQYMGVILRKKLDGKSAHRLLKPYPGFHAVMDDVLERLREDNHLLELKFDPDEVEDQLARALDLQARNAILEQVLAGSDAERQEADNALMRVLIDSVRRVREESSTHPQLLQSWQPILAFVKQFRRGPSDEE